MTATWSRCWSDAYARRSTPTATSPRDRDLAWPWLSPEQGRQHGVSRSITHRLLVSNLPIRIAFLGPGWCGTRPRVPQQHRNRAREQLQAHVYTLLTAARKDERGHMRLPTSLAALIQPARLQPVCEITVTTGPTTGDPVSMLGRFAPLVGNASPGDPFSPLIRVFTQGYRVGGQPRGTDHTPRWRSTGAPGRRLSFRSTLWRWLGGVALLRCSPRRSSPRWGHAASAI